MKTRQRSAHCVPFCHRSRRFLPAVLFLTPFLNVVSAANPTITLQVSSETCVIRFAPENVLRHWLFFIVLILNPLSLMAQPSRLESALADAKVRKAIAFVDSHTTQTAEYLASIAAIISPSGNE